MRYLWLFRLQHVIIFLKSVCIGWLQCVKWAVVQSIGNADWTIAVALDVGFANWFWLSRLKKGKAVLSWYWPCHLQHLTHEILSKINHKKDRSGSIYVVTLLYIQQHSIKLLFSLQLGGWQRRGKGWIPKISTRRIQTLIPSGLIDKLFVKFNFDWIFFQSATFK